MRQVGIVFLPISGSLSLGYRHWALSLPARLSAPRSSREAGVEVHEGAHVRDILVETALCREVEGTVDGARMILRAPLTIGADGRHGVVSRALGLDIPLRWPQRTGLVADYLGVTGLGAWGEIHVASGRHGYAGLAPLEEGLTNVAFVSASAAVANRPGSLEAYFADGLSASRLLPRGLPGRSESAASAASDPLAHRAHQVIGDGSCWLGMPRASLDPFTGDGIHEALRGATLLAPVADGALRAGDLSCAANAAPYRAARRRAFWAKRQVCWLVQGFIATPALMDYATARLACAAVRPHGPWLAYWVISTRAPGARPVFLGHGCSWRTRPSPPALTPKNTTRSCGYPALSETGEGLSTAARPLSPRSGRRAGDEGATAARTTAPRTQAITPRRVTA